MAQWFRVFGTSDTVLEPIAVVRGVSALGVSARGKFHDDNLDWFEAELIIDDSSTLLLERYLAVDNIRPALDTWAAWLETTEEICYHRWLMEHVIGTCQLFTLHQQFAEPDDRPTDPNVEEVCDGLCRFLARQTSGVYQVDGRGFFDADGMLLVGEEEEDSSEEDDDGDDDLP